MSNNLLLRAYDALEYGVSVVEKRNLVREIGFYLTKCNDRHAGDFVEGEFYPTPAFKNSSFGKVVPLFYAPVSRKRMTEQEQRALFNKRTGLTATTHQREYTIFLQGLHHEN